MSCGRVGSRPFSGCLRTIQNSWLGAPLNRTQSRGSFTRLSAVALDRHKAGKFATALGDASAHGC